MKYFRYLTLFTSVCGLIFILPSITWAFPETSQTNISQTLIENNNTSKYTGIVKQVDDMAQKITVRIDVADGENGSGVIIGKQGNTYYVATACHVVSQPGYGRKCTTEHLRDSFTLITPDGEKYFLKSAANQIIILNPDFDVAVVKFTSDKSYQVAELGDYQLEDKQWLFLSGFPGQDNNKQRRLTAGRVLDKYLSAFAIAKDHFSLSSGNELVYSNLSFGGMSGGAVLDTQGRVIGINTGSEDEVFISSEGKYQEVSLGFSLGVPMTTFLGLASRGEVPAQSLRIISTVAKKINSEDSQQIEAQLFIFKEPSKDSNALDWLNYANELWRGFRYQDAIAAFNQAIQRLEKEGNKDILAKAYYAKGLALGNGGKAQEALEAFKQATVNNNRFHQAWRYEVKVLEELQQYTEALAAYQQAIKIKPNDFTLYVEQGYVLHQLTRYQEALNSYQQAINLKPNHPWNYNNRGVLYHNQQKGELALSDYDQALALHPDWAEAYNNRGAVYYTQEKWELALSDYNQAIALNPKDASAYAFRGVVYLQMGNKQAAIEDFQKVAQLLQEQGNTAGYEKAMETLRQLGVQ